MPRSLMTFATLAGILIASTSAVSGKECKCRYFNQRAEIGAVACIKGRLAQCMMFQNNPSWKFISDTCPQSRNDSKPQKTQSKEKIAAR